MTAFPYMSTKMNALLYFVALFIATLDIFLIAIGSPPVVLPFLMFIGVFITGWSLIGFMVAKQLLPVQRQIAAFFAVLLLTALLGVGVSFQFRIL
nr:hypothetical protein [Candidatus Njordarchaeota archaeon]